MAAVEKVEKECEEETLQTAFKKLRVDAERFVVFSCVSATVCLISEMDAHYFGREVFCTVWVIACISFQFHNRSPCL